MLMVLHRYTQLLLNAGIKVVVPTILDELPHDPRAFTQGLAYAQGKLYESTGLNKESSIRQIDSISGKVENVRQLPGHFGEGLAVQGKRIVQLTFQSNIAFVYRLDDFSIVDEWPYDGEGWGLTATHNGFVMTNGGSELLFRNQCFDLVRTVKVRRKGMPLHWLNDLECARGRLFVHRLGDRYLFEIDPSCGSILRLIDGASLIRCAQPKGPVDVFNGIAYDPIGDIFFMTGKRWPVLFKVHIPVDQCE